MAIPQFRPKRMKTGVREMPRYEPGPAVPIRYVEVRGKRYLLAEDVATYIQDLAATKEVDVGERLYEAAYRLTKTS